MNGHPRKFKELILTVLFLVFFASTVFVNLSCDEESPVKGPECGSGKNSWDAKALRCRDDETGRIVPDACCGR